MNARDNQPAWPLLGAALWLCASCAYLAVRYEPFTPDSYVYVAAAKQALETGHFALPFASSTATSLPAPLSSWPPGYPALIAALAATGLDAWHAARCVTLACTLLTFVLGALWLARRPGGWMGLALALACSTTAVVSVTAWSEGAFLLALGGAVAALATLEEREHEVSWSAILCLVLCLASALLIRHAGWFVLPVFAWYGLKRSGSIRWITTAALVLACLPAAVWLWEHRPLGPEAGTLLEPWRMIRSTGQTIAAFGKLVVSPWSAPRPWVALPGVLVLGALGFVQWRTRRAQSGRERLLWAVGWSLFAGTWLVGLANPAPFFATDRLLWPSWIVLAVALGTSIRLLAAPVFRITMALLLTSQTAGVIRVPVLEQRPAGPKRDFQDSHQLLTNQMVVSNEAWRAWGLWRAQGYYLPRAQHGHELFSPDTLAQWASRRRVDYLVWFADGLSESQSVERFGELARAGYGRPPDVLELVAEDSICHTYRIRSAGTP